MLTSLTIDGLRGIAHGELKDIAPLSVIVGTNGSGKSTVLDALNIVANPSTGEALAAATKRRSLPSSFLRWLMPKGKLMSVAQLTATNCGESCKVELRGDVQLGVVWLGEACRESDQPYARWDGLINIHGVPVNPHTTHLGIANLRLIDSHGKDVLRPIHELHTIAVETGHRDAERALIAEILPGAEHIEVLSDQNAPVAHVVYSDHSVPVALVGDGIEVVIRLALELMVLEDGLVLLEEPEVHLHPAALAMAARVIVSAVRRGIQVILTTHSLELIDNLIAACETAEDLKNMAVFRVLLEEGILKSTRIAGERVAQLRSQIEDDLR